MKILTAGQIREADRYTIENEPISSIDLMERAALSITDYLTGIYDIDTCFVIFAGKGNNGGDGLAVARLLSQRGYACTVVIVFGSEGGSPEYLENLERLPAGVRTVALTDYVQPAEKCAVIDALLGTGVSGELREPAISAIDAINRSRGDIISIDLPSGMMTGFGNEGRTMVKADITLSLEFPKLAMMLPEAGENTGKLVVLPIGLMENFTTPYYYTTKEDIHMARRPKFAHKGNFGSALLACGSEGMIGAAVLAALGALRSGCGLVTSLVAEKYSGVMYAAVPQAMVVNAIPADASKYTAVCCGCGIGRSKESAAMLEGLMELSKPMVLDADALNILSETRTLLRLIPPGSVLTPHVGELRRLVGEWRGEEDKFVRTKALAAETNAYIVLKGAHTAVFTPTAEVYFNSTGNPGMAKAGSGDVLAGFIAGLLAKGLAPAEAARAGVFFHGSAGDRAAARLGEESVNSYDILEELRII